jgi:putative transcriptional regulator
MKNMTVKHTLNDELMMGYAAGILPEAFNLVVATHLSLCDESRAGVESYEAVGGVVLESTETAKMSSGALADCLKRIKTEQPCRPPRARPRVCCSSRPVPPCPTTVIAGPS